MTLLKISLPVILAYTAQPEERLISMELLEKDLQFVIPGLLLLLRELVIMVVNI